MLGRAHGRLLASAHDTSPGATPPHRHGGDFSGFTTMLKLETAVSRRAAADRIGDTIARTAHTDRREDGKGFAWPLTRAILVRTLA